ncbi:MAG: hypothetical protein U5R46_15940 [Gammaproteobacteria bacterium]|nr:hypothetical protein [Gammaproteobacteria bacterium]
MTTNRNAGIAVGCETSNHVDERSLTGVEGRGGPGDRTRLAAAFRELGRGVGATVACERTRNFYRSGGRA